MSALLVSLLSKIIPYLAVAALGTVGYLIHKRDKKRLEDDKMVEKRDETLNQVSQINATQKVEQDMSQAQTDTPTVDQVVASEKDGTF